MNEEHFRFKMQWQSSSYKIGNSAWLDVDREIKKIPTTAELEQQYKDYVNFHITCIDSLLLEEPVILNGFGGRRFKYMYKKRKGFDQIVSEKTIFFTSDQQYDFSCHYIDKFALELTPVINMIFSSIRFPHRFLPKARFQITGLARNSYLPHLRLSRQLLHFVYTFLQALY